MSRIQHIAVMFAVVATLGALPAQKAHAFEPFIGQIIWVGFNYCPRGFAEADGRLLPVSQNSALFSLYGTIYGGDGRTTFALPDLRGRVPMSDGHGPGLSSRQLGQRGGAERVTLTQQNMPSHSHGVGAAAATLKGSSAAGDTAEPEGAMLADGQRAAIYAQGPVDAGSHVDMAAESIALSGGTDNTGGSQSHENMQPFTVIRACVATIGIFPSRS